MCTNCGCAAGETRIEGQELEHVDEHAHADGTVHGHAPHHHGEHDHDHGPAYRAVRGTDHLHYGHGPAGAHAPGMSQARMVKIEQDILGKNNAYAAQNRRWFDEHGVFALNFVSSPGSGKTTLLVRTIEALKSTSRLAVIEGDQQTSFDAERIRATGVQALQINTGKGCHLDAHMVGHALEKLRPEDESVLLIENVGNLVCPSAFDLGEAHKVVILSVTEGEDKPLKYPDMFRAASLMLLNKCDLLPHLSFDVERAIEYAKRVNPDLHVIRTSSATGEGFDAWLTWIADGLAGQAARRSQSMELLRSRIAGLEAQLAALKV
ncbi:hydrogenase nickel incorporation protein HypB (plasmid) [Cupriavidus necator H16]|uniref:Hydrogenase maturation factor HypB n=1 Tax=Cupriavidus necator (strain ATCC 17699 / DSM 428 / KCTC 22496 / NCIMB 10442 / H16 / Stanier 337) TaxID=381666 RepID=Q7WXM8_CUPNH|nr:hydrogenase nickel incorporation protein HypB [Cupriavidus necator]AAP85848.1 HypB2 [Cupriavidus necator H16]QCC05354.1 hydrogenase nickel incorporation protein HypB [Cupriavidus necator H16]QQB81525.1 hydrogenase nickel incorporation protein HypB [Cupriavidus necator]